MAIALFDWDLIYWQQPTVFNLELMKIATSLRSKRQIMKMVDQIDIERYTETILRKDYEDNYYPSKAFNNPRVTPSGLVFMTGGYQPMDMDIELSVPSPDIYEQFSFYYQENRHTRYLFSSMLREPHARLSFDGLTVHPEWKKQIDWEQTKPFHALYIHDKDLDQIEGSAAAIREVLQNFISKGQRVGFKFPVRVYGEKELRDWTRFKRIEGTAPIVLSRFITDKAILNVLDNDWRYQPFTYSLSSQWFDPAMLADIFKQGIYMVSKYCLFEIEIVDPEWYDPLVRDTIEVLNDYFKSLLAARRERDWTPFTFYDWVKRTRADNMKDPFGREKFSTLKHKGHDIFRYWYEEDYDLFTLFYECEEVVVEDGLFDQKGGKKRALSRNGGFIGGRPWQYNSGKSYSFKGRTYGPDGSIEGRIKPWYKEPER